TSGGKMQTNKKCCCRFWTSIISGIIFVVIAIVHLLRAILGWSATIDGTEFPLWLSWLIVVIAAILAGLNFRSCYCKKCDQCTKPCCTKDLPVPPPKTR